MSKTSVKNHFLSFGRFPNQGDFRGDLEQFSRRCGQFNSTNSSRIGKCEGEEVMVIKL